MPSEQSLVSAGVAAFTCRLDGVVLAWSRAAERMFAVEAAEAVGRRCHEMVGGRDLFGNPFCSGRCACRQTAARGQAIRPFLLEIRDGRGCPFRVRATILITNGASGETELVHLLDAVTSHFPFPQNPLVGRELQKASRIGPEFLTRRELEVLRCLALGLGTREVGAELGIRVSTVRRHVANCLSKLGVHSRLEAIVMAHRLDLVRPFSTRDS
jgi:DNA-binding CsgD family transcriptional regulator